MTKELRDAPQFYLTSPSACPYLPGREERKVFTHLVGRRSVALNETLTQSGFRRSQTIAYRPACENCRACVSVRVCVNEFEPSRSFRKILAKNTDLHVRMVENKARGEHFSLFRYYLDSRHSDGGMADMSMLDYAMMVEDSHVDTRVMEYRGPAGAQGQPGELLCASLTDVLSDGLSMVYSFYNPDYEARSLGSLMILNHIEQCRHMGLPHLYLGYWIEGSRKMDYKARFLPQERLGMNGWARVEAD